MPDDDLTARFPLIAESPLSIIARLLVDINAGIDPTDPAYADILPGSWFSDMSGAFALEGDRIYDRMLTELPAAALPQTAIGAWLDGWADVVNLQRKPATSAGGAVAFTGPENTAIATGAQVSTEAPNADADPVTFQSTEGGVIVGGSVTLQVVALDAGTQGNVPANAITVLNTPLNGVSITNPDATSSGSDIETDDALSTRVMSKLRGTNGAGNVAYYENLALNYPGVGYVTVQPNTPSIGHVTVVVSDVNHEPVSSVLLDGLQQQLDPSDSPGQGAGLAAPGATVIVATPVATIVTVAAAILLEADYSIDGASGTQSVAADVLTSVNRYFLTLTAGEPVVHNKVLAAIIDVDGVDDVRSVTLNGDSGGDLAIASDHVAELNADIGLSLSSQTGFLLDQALLDQDEL